MPRPMQTLALIFMGLLRRLYHLMARHRWTAVLVCAGFLIGLGYYVSARRWLSLAGLV